MPDEKKQDDRQWYEHDRVQGGALIIIGIAMCFFPPTAPHAGAVIAAGTGWASAGLKNAVVRIFKK